MSVTAGMLDAERKRASFDVASLLEVVARKKPEALKKFQPLFDKAPFDGEDMDDYLSYEEMFSKKMDRVTEAFKIVRTNPSFMVHHMKQKVQMGEMFEHTGIFLHFTMMLSFIKSQGDAEQQKFWLEKAQNGDFIAAYCQTELGHGSNVRGLETTATYVPETQEFEIHSPNLTSLKWWPTGMYACTHALVFAQLISNGQNHGFSGFMVQLRQSDGTLMPGVEVGEIGPKMNQSSTNIGYARFTRVRVPKNHLFSKFSSLAADGTYTAAPRKLSKFRYISMMVARVAIVQIAYEQLAKATTIAIRYSAVREQGFKQSSGEDSSTEHVVLDYQMQRYRTFKALSLSYCLLWNTRYIKDYFKTVREAIDSGGAAADAAAEDLPALHATLSGMKATATVLSHDAIEECRKCCGGQGFLRSSGIAKLSPDFSEWVTVEGEQVILSLQLARYLMKAVDEVTQGVEVSESVRYLGDHTTAASAATASAATTVPAIGTAALSTTILDVLQQRSRILSTRLAVRCNKATASGGVSFDDALNSMAVLAYRAAEAHSVYFMLANNHKAVEEYFKKERDTKLVLTQLFQLQGLMRLTEAKPGEINGPFASFNGSTAALVEGAEERLEELLQAIRPNAVSLVDAFGFLDGQLKSTIGRHDGEVYEAIYEEARRNPLNQTAGGKMVGWDNYSTVLDLDFLATTAKLQRVVTKARL